MATTTISAWRRGRACSFVRLLAAAVLLAAFGACGGAAVPENAPPADSEPVLPDAGPTAAAEPPDGSPADEAPSPDRVILNGEELPPELASAFLQAMEDRGSLPADVAERLPGRRGPNVEAAPSAVDVGPDWSVVEEYLDRQRAWMESNRQLARPSGDVTSEERVRAMTERLADRPDVRRAAAAAMAILEQDGTHEKTVDAAEFLALRVQSGGPMPWTNWHAGLGSDIARLLRVQGYPTYVLVDENGRILARPLGRFQEIALPPGAPPDSFPGVPPSLPDLIREVLAGLPPA